MKEKMKKISNVCKTIFGYGIMISLALGGLTFFGYLFALCVGGELATTICVFMYKKIIPVAIYMSTIMILLGLIAMYLAGEFALTAKKKETSKHEGEM